jgi:hypothetical protein
MYFGYYILKTPRKQFYKYFSFVKKEKHLSSFSLYKDIIFSSFKYNISIIDYFKLRFINKTSRERKEYVGVGFMYEYQLKMNPKGYRELLENKIKFLGHFGELAGRQWATFEMLQQDSALLQRFLEDEKGKVVVKYSRGQCGQQVRVIETGNIAGRDLLDLMVRNKFDLIETFVVQHDDLMRIAPRGLNTIRMVTQFISESDIQIVGAGLRLSIYESVDNMGAGNIVLPLDLRSGITTDSASYADITKQDVKTHPLTGLDLVGFRVPHWEACKDLAIEAARLTPENKSVGWDIAVTKTGPVLIEGNHDWGHESLQVPLRKGIKKKLLQFIHT